MARFVDGDGVAYEALVRRHLEFVVRHARRYVGDESSAEDVAQEVFVRLYRSAGLFREPVSFRGWLATMTSRLALNEMRTRRRKRWTARSGLPELQGSEWRPGPGETHSAEDRITAEERALIVREAVADLPERQRLAIWLQRFEGWPLEEIGSTMSLSVPAVKSLLHRARQALLETLSARLGSDPWEAERSAE
ncbi:MAG: sigma-70 family RNA polymerase sigma factor [Planctomycetes bacterium]|nr:sigma-70 family RNA polymerase sigma factor [Planctomycetota bacterium]